MDRLMLAKGTRGPWRAAAVGAALLLAAVSGPASAQSPPAGDDAVVAQRGPISLTAGQVREMIQNADPALRHQLATDPRAMVNYVRDQMLQMAVLAEAKAHQWDTRPDVAWRADQAREAAIANSYIASLSQPDPSFPSDAEVQSAYDANRARLVVPRQYHVAQIFLAIPPGAPASADTAAQKKLADLRAQVLHSHADFAALARRLSDDHVSGGSGGDMGWVREDQMLPPIRTAVAGLPEGSVAEPVRLTDGWHLLRMLGTKPAGPASLAEARPALVRALRQQRTQEAAQAYVNDLLKQDPIKINEIELSGLAPK